ncbi:MAG: iron-containing alcohol dehydrogenase, partial [Bacteroidota bacterium]
LEGVGDKQPKGKKLPFIAVPTTAGTGSEGTKNAVLSEVGTDGFKKSLRHDAFVPNLALIDPELMLSCPPELTASSGMDAFTQLLEAYVSTKRSGMTDALAWEGLQYLAQGLEKAYHDGTDLQARSHMAYAALLSGIALANAGLGVVHGFASSIGGRIDIPHGTLCGTLMGIANRITLKKLLDQNPHSEVVKKYAAVGQLFSQEENRFGMYYANALIDLMEEYTYDFSLPRLSKFGLREGDISQIVSNTGQKNHPVELTTTEMELILRRRL